jgi:DNA-binding transcriptional MerR regulator
VKATIKQVSEKTGLSTYVLRYYEKEGLLPHVGRSESGIRLYSEADLEWLGLICCLKKTGMSIKQIRDFVELCSQGSSTLDQRRELLVEHKENVELKIQELYKYLEKIDCKIECLARERAC